MRYRVLIPLIVLLTFASSASQQPSLMRPKSILSGHRKAIGAIAFSPDGLTLATGSGEPSARLWDLAKGQTRAVLDAHPYVGGLSFSPDGRMVATWSYGGTIRLWDTRSGALKAVLTEPKEFVDSVAFSPDGTLVASSSIYDLSAKLWDTATGGQKATLTHPKPYRYANGVDGVVFSLDRKTLITSSNRTIYLWDWATARLRSKLVDPDVRIYDGFKALKGFSHGDTIYDVAISPDGDTLATVSRDHTAKLWDLDSGKLRATLPHGGKVWFVVFSPDSKTLATGSDDRTARLWNVSSGKLIATLPHKGTVHSLSFSADGAVISTASDNEKWVNIWRVATGEKLAELPEARPPVVFSPIDRTLATASRGSDILLWDIPFR